MEESPERKRRLRGVAAIVSDRASDLAVAESAPDRPWNETFGEAERSGFRLQLKVRSLVLLVITMAFIATVPLARALTYAAFCGGLVLAGVAVDRIVVCLSASRWRLLAALLILLDVTLLGVVIAMPSLVMEHPWPPQMALRFYTFLYLPLYIMGSALTTSPALVLWTGISAAAIWSACVWWVLRQPGTLSVGNLRLVDADIGTAEQLRVFLDPHFVSIVAFQAQILVLLVGSAVLAFGVRRAHVILLERTRIAAERRSLSRFVPRDLADDLAAGPQPGAVRRRKVGVMFVDIVGYTALAERLDPEAALQLLGVFHGRVAATVRDHGGTLDKFIGDAVMATFGTGTHSCGLDAAAALRCALAVHDDIDAWNIERRAHAEEPLRIGIGLHCGEALVGTIGSPDRLEHTVIGDVVNVASRLERLTRKASSPVLVSEAVFAEAKRTGSNMDASERFGPAIDLAIRGRRKTVMVRTLEPAFSEARR